MSISNLLSQDDKVLAEFVLKTIKEILVNEDSTDEIIKIADNKKAIFISGGWGVGKTKFIEYVFNTRLTSSIKESPVREIISYLIKGDTKYIENQYKKEILYISVFGLKNKQEILQAILKEYLDRSGNNDEKKKLSQTILNIGASLFKLNKELLEATNPIDLVTLEKTVMKILNQKIVVFDDIERIGNIESFIDLFSLVNSCQQNLIKEKKQEVCFLLIANEDELEKSFSRMHSNNISLHMNTEYDNILEKVVRFKLKLPNSIERVIKIIEKNQSIKQWQSIKLGSFTNLIMYFELYNLRFIKDCLETFVNFKIANNNFEKPYLEENLLLLIIFFKYLYVFTNKKYIYTKSIDILKINQFHFKPSKNLLFLVEKKYIDNGSFAENVFLYTKEVNDFKEEKNDKGFLQYLIDCIIEKEESYKNRIKERRKERYLKEFKEKLNSLVIEWKYLALDDEFFPNFDNYEKTFKEKIYSIYVNYLNQSYEEISKNKFKDTVFEFINKELDAINETSIKESENSENSDFTYDEVSKEILKNVQKINNQFYHDWIAFFTELELLDFNDEEKNDIELFDIKNDSRLANLYLIFEFNFMKYCNINLDLYNQDFIKEFKVIIETFNGSKCLTQSIFGDYTDDIETEFFQQDIQSFEKIILQQSLEKKPYIYTEQDIIDYCNFIVENINKLSLENLNFICYLKDACNFLHKDNIENIIGGIIDKIISQKLIITIAENSKNSATDLFIQNINQSIKEICEKSNYNFLSIGTTFVPLEKNSIKIKKDLNKSSINKIYNKKIFNILNKLLSRLALIDGERLYISEDEKIVYLSEADINEIKKVKDMSENELLILFKNSDLYTLKAMRIVYVYDKYHNSDSVFEFKNKDLHKCIINLKITFEKYLNQLEDSELYIKLYFAYYNKFYYKALQPTSDISEEIII